MDVAAYAALVGDAIERVDAVADGPNGPLFQLRNVGHVRHLGAEGSVRARPVRAVELSVGGALLSREARDPGIVLTDVPARRAYAWLDIRPVLRGPIAGLSALARVETASRRFSTTEGAVAEGFTVADVLVRYALPPSALGKLGRASVEVGARNLFDTRYALVEGFPEPGRTLSLSLVYSDR